MDAASFKEWPLTTSVAAVSAGLVGDRAVLDLDYDEDSRAEVDLNIVMTGEVEFVEIQGSAETAPFADASLQEMLRLARLGVAEITMKQRMALEA